MQQAFLKINGVRTSVMTCGRWVEESPDPSEPEDIILIVPGNPGSTGFYRPFIQNLYDRVKYPVWIVGHAGHEVPNNNSVDPIPSLEHHKDLFGLQGQIKHKADFVQKYVPKNARLHLIGHSIGSYIILELMKYDDIKTKVVGIDLLFPTIEHMGHTSNGKFLTKFVKPIVWLILLLALIFAILPSVLLNFIMHCYMKISSIPKFHFQNLIHFIHPSVLEKVFFMAFEEFEQVKERNTSILQENLGKIHMLYGSKDDWTPSSYYEKLKSDIPGIKTEVKDLEHTFVLSQSHIVANIVADWISGR